MLVAALVLGLGMVFSLPARPVQAQETERRARSRELRDEVGQSLSAALVELRNLSAGLKVRSEERRAAMLKPSKA